jgi:hypothetical protein
MTEHKHHPLLFTAEMVRAILAHRKWQTRRVITAHNSLIDGTGEGIKKHWPHLAWARAWVDNGPSPIGNPGPYWHVPCRCLGDAPDLEVVHRVYPRVQTGDSLWVKETWAIWDYPRMKIGTVRYRAEGEFTKTERKMGWRWFSSQHMPRRLSRITLPDVTVRAQRVQDTSEVDAVAEGVCVGDAGAQLYPCRAFAGLWDSINSKRGYGWDKNPPVWIYQWEKALDGRGREV